MPPKNTKLFVLDTNVILHDSTCLHQFQEHDVVLPICVLEELDKFKKGNETLNFHARHFLKEMDTISGDGAFNGATGALPGNPQVVNKANSATTVSSSANPSAPGQTGTFTATVGPSPPPPSRKTMPPSAGMGLGSL